MKVRFISFLKKPETLLFISFFIVYTIFIQWNGWDENSRYFLTRAIVDEGHLSIDSFANQTSDRTLYNGHYYSDKDPGTSFFAAIPYSLFKLFYYNNGSSDAKSNQIFFANTIGDSTIYDILNPDYFTLYSMIVVVVFTSVLFSALTVVLIYKVASMFTESRNVKLAIALTAGLATIIFPYALVFTDNAITGFFALLGFYLLLKGKHLKANNDRTKFSFFAGACFAVATITSIFGLLVALVSFLYIFSFRDKKSKHLLYFIISFLAIGSIYMAYNYAIYKNPFQLSYLHLDKSIFIFSKQNPNPYAILKVFIPNIFIMWRLLLDPYKGIFFYYPILLLGFYGLYLMWKKLKMTAEVILILAIFALNVIPISSEQMWWGGGFFGPRHLTYFVPFFIIPLIFVLNQKSKIDRVMKIIFTILFAYSMLVNFAGIRVPAQEIIAPDKLTVDPQYAPKLYSFEILENPIFDYYIPGFFKTGPTSRMVQTFSDCDYRVDIRQPLPISAENCTKPMVAEGEVTVPQNKSLKLCACSQYGGGDGVIFNFAIDGTQNYVHIESNKCKTEIFDVPYIANETHRIKVIPGVYGICDEEGVIIRELALVNQNISETRKPLPMYFDFKNSFEAWNSTGNTQYTMTGIVLGVGDCDSTSSIENAVRIPPDARTMTVRACADYAGGDGTTVKVSIDNEKHIFEIPSSLCQEKNFDVRRFADGKEHLIKIESGINGNCDKEGPEINWIKITD